MLLMVFEQFLLFCGFKGFSMLSLTVPTILFNFHF